jgi:signal transduction histidine kinase
MTSRTSPRGLHPAALEESGLIVALRDLATRTVMRVDVDLPDDALPGPIASALYYVCSEGIANAVKHAHATRIRILGGINERRVRVEIVDDGLGGADQTGSGLRGLADRVETLGGTFTVASVPGVGTRLTAELPLDGEA